MCNNAGYKRWNVYLYNTLACWTLACATRLRYEVRLPSKVAQMLEPIVYAPHLASAQLRRCAAPRLRRCAARLGGCVRACCRG